MAGRLLFDVTGQLQWYANLRHASGIQRVTEHILGSAPIRDYPRLEFIMRPIGSGQFFRLSPQLIYALCDSDRRWNAIAQLRGVFAQAMRYAPLWNCVRELRYFDVPYFLGGLAHLEKPIVRWNGADHTSLAPSVTPIAPPTSNDTFLNTGDFWCHRRYVDSVINLKHKTGVRVVVLVHDLFYIEKPEWNHPGFQNFAAQLHKFAPSVDVWLVTSKFVKSQVRDYLSSCGISDADIRILPMGGGLLSLQCPVTHKEKAAVLRKFGLEREQYFLSVGKIEPRRNHIALLDAFRQVRTRGVQPLPICVIVGQDGWKSSDFRTRLRMTANECNTVKWLQDVTDLELSVLYSSALFCVVPSEVEGWGLPIRESIAHGVPCLASSSGGAVEAGRDLATYFDPTEPESLTSVLFTWLSDDAALSRARARIASHSDSWMEDWEAAGKAVLEASIGCTGRRAG